MITQYAQSSMLTAGVSERSASATLAKPLPAGWAAEHTSAQIRAEGCCAANARDTVGMSDANTMAATIHQLASRRPGALRKVLLR